MIVCISSLPQNTLHEHQQKNSFNTNQNNIICFQSREIELSFKFMFIGAFTKIFLDGKSIWSITECSSWIPIVNFYFQSSKQLSFQRDWGSFKYFLKCASFGRKKAFMLWTIRFKINTGLIRLRSNRSRIYYALHRLCSITKHINASTL